MTELELVSLMAADLLAAEVRRDIKRTDEAIKASAANAVSLYREVQKYTWADLGLRRPTTQDPHDSAKD